uniref:hypothetical protein n=1 Tax=Nonomuraea sp. CA-251285 TaxID=3240002 RepID=UPI003F496D92
MSSQTVPGQLAAFHAECVQSAELGGSGEHAAIAVLLAHPAAHNPRFVRHVDRSGIDWSDVLDEDWSETQDFLLRVAAGLWGYGAKVDMKWVAWLDEDQYKLFQDMLQARLTGRVPAQAST